MPRLNKTLVENLAIPVGSEITIMDSEVQGFGIRAHPSGIKAYFVRYRVEGGRRAQSRRQTLGRHPALSADKARQQARDVLAKARIGRDLALEKSNRRNSLSVEELVREWLDGPGKRTRRGLLKSDASFGSDAARLNHHVVPIIGRVRLCDLSRVHVERVRDAVASGKTATLRHKTKARGICHVRGGEGVATRTIAGLSTLLGYAVERGLAERNVALGVHKAKDRRCERFLSPAEVQTLWSTLDRSGSANPSAIQILRLLLMTGCRLSEVAGLEWLEVDLASGVIMLRDGKTGARPVYLSEDAKTLLAHTARIEGSRWVFPATRGNGHYKGTPKVWRVIRTRAGLSGVRIHDLRHTFASLALGKNIPLEVISKLLGHGEIRTTARYAHLARGAIFQAVNSVGDIFVNRGE